MNHGWLIYSIPQPKWHGPHWPQQVSILNSFPISTNYAPSALLWLHMRCARVFFSLCSRNPPKMQIIQVALNNLQTSTWKSRNKEWPNAHVSKNMYPILPARDYTQNCGSHVYHGAQHHASARNLLATAQPHTPKPSETYVYPIIPWHNIPQEHVLFSSFLWQKQGFEPNCLGAVYPKTQR